MATAVAMPEAKPSSDSTVYARGATTFHLADPSYIGAGIGEVMERYRGGGGKVDAFLSFPGQGICDAEHRRIDS